uniref:EF-hand domain-containing protein n=1 Tax=Astyanax mexicanus TaxID=7994 RepID=A0A3B1IWP1_ASTMX
MLACTEMITMCLQSAKREHLRSKQQQQLQQNHGLSIFHDIFRRADKNDDGKLSFEEFKAYFADGILTTDELQELFYSIDGRQAKYVPPLHPLSQHRFNISLLPIRASFRWLCFFGDTCLVPLNCCSQLDMRHSLPLEAFAKKKKNNNKKINK